MDKNPNRTRIERVSGIFRTLALVGMVFWGLAFVGIGVSTVLEWGEEATTYYLVMSFVFVLAFVTTFHFYRFFARLRAGHLFDATTVGHLHQAGRWWMVAWAYQFVVTIGARRGGMSHLSVEFSGLLAASVVLFISWLLREAQGMQQDVELMV